MSARLQGFLVGALLAVMAFVTLQASAEGPVHAVRPGMQNAACSHCHETPHGADDTDRKRFDACGSCHDEVHFVPSTFTVERHATLSFALEGKHIDVACGSCHVQKSLVGLPSECAGCHIDRHRGILGEDCTACHSVAGFKPVPDFSHSRTGFELTGPHDGIDCAACHQGSNGDKLRQGAGQDCQSCHQPAHGDFGRPCVSCHALDKGRSFASARTAFDHRTTGFSLERRHGSQPCISCHTVGARKPDPRCASCHINPHSGQLGGRCEDCHQPDRWSLVRFDHDSSAFPLRGAHFMATCTECHTAQRWIGLPNACWDCHATDATRAPRTVEAHRFGRVDCADCHNTWKWRF